MPLVIINGIVQGEDEGAGEWGTPTALTIASGVITVTGPGFYEVDTEGAAASDDLDTISGGSEGDEIILKIANDARNVVVKHGTAGSDNIDLIDLDITMDTTNQRVRLQRGSTNWAELSSRP